MDSLARLRWIIAAATVAPFLFGVAGPFVLDDHVNLAPVWQWLHGQRDFLETVFGNRSGPAGRPLAYLTLMGNAAVGGNDAFGFKLVNIALHAGAALLVFELVRRVLAMVAPERTALMACAITLAWAVHPMQVSTVLYVVQRMAMLGSMAQVAAVLIYIAGRQALGADPRRARALLFGAFPFALLLGLGAKETVLVAPLLCLVTEFVMFAARPRTREVPAFFAFFLVVPALGALAWAVAADKFGAGYLGREFTLAQRLLAEPRVLLDYATGWFWPAKLALYRDGYPYSAQAAVAIAVWTLLLFAAIATRRRAPLFAFGILWFLAAHSLEAGPFALELYFEHRNYLPSLGLLFAAVGLLPARSARHAPAALLVLVAVLASLTAARAWQWGDLDRLLATESPRAGEISRRLQIDRAIRATERRDSAARDAALDHLATGTPGDRAAASIWTAIFACDGSGALASATRESLLANPPFVLTHGHLSWLDILSRRAVSGACQGLARDDMRAVLDAWERGARQPLSAHARWRMSQLRQQLSESGS